MDQLLQILLLPAEQLLAALRTDVLWAELPPEMRPMVGCEHNPTHHPEGDVWEHTILVCYHAAKFVEQGRVPAEWRSAFVLGALLHDIGKPLTVDPETREMRGHAAAGEAPARAVLRRWDIDDKITEQVITLVVNHMRVPACVEAKEKSWRKVHAKIPLNIAALLARCDAAAAQKDGCPGADIADQMYTKFTEVAEKKTTEPEFEPKLTGKHLLDRGMKPGPQFKVVLQRAIEAQKDNPELSADELFALATA